MRGPSDPAASPPLPAVRITWGLPDAAAIWLAGNVVAGVVISLFRGLGTDVGATGFALGVGFPAQDLPMIAVAAWLSRRKGAGSLARDFGLRVDLADVRYLGLGFVTQYVLTVMLFPIIRVSHRSETPQELVRAVEQSRGVGLAILLVLAAVVVAPVVEELVFRGVLLRALLRRTTDGWSIVVSALLFAAVHVLGDPGSALVFPALTGLGCLLGALAVRSGSLSRPILVHAGFNLFTTVLVLMKP